MHAATPAAMWGSVSETFASLIIFTTMVVESCGSVVWPTTAGGYALHAVLVEIVDANTDPRRVLKRHLELDVPQLLVEAVLRIVHELDGAGSYYGARLLVLQGSRVVSEVRVLVSSVGIYHYLVDSEPGIGSNGSEPTAYEPVNFYARDFPRDGSVDPVPRELGVRAYRLQSLSILPAVAFVKEVNTAPTRSQCPVCGSPTPANRPGRSASGFEAFLLARDYLQVQVSELRTRLDTKKAPGADDRR